MSRLGERFPAADLPHIALGTGPTPVTRLDLAGLGGEVWIKDEGVFGDGGWGGNKVRKLEWIIPEAHRRGRSTILTVGGIGTHWGLAAALYGRENGLRTVLGLIDQPVDDHVREQLRRLGDSGAILHRYPSVGRLKLAAPWLLSRYSSRGRLPYYLPAGGSSPVGSLAYVETALEIAAQVEAGVMPEPATIVTAVGSGGTAAGLLLGLRLAGLRTRVLGVVVNDSFRLDAVTISALANKTAALLRARGADVSIAFDHHDLTASDDWLGETYGATTAAGSEAIAAAAQIGLELEPVYTAKALGAIRELGSHIDGPVLFLQTHGPRPEGPAAT